MIRFDEHVLAVANGLVCAVLTSQRSEAELFDVSTYAVGRSNVVRLQFGITTSALLIEIVVVTMIRFLESTNGAWRVYWVVNCH